MIIEEFFKESILQTLFNARKEKFEYYVQSTSKKDIEQKAEIENRLKALLNYIDGTHYEHAQKEMDEILWKMIEYTTFWNELFYKYGVVDGMNLKEEIKEELEKSAKWKKK